MKRYYYKNGITYYNLKEPSDDENLTEITKEEFDAHVRELENKKGFKQ